MHFCVSIVIAWAVNWEHSNNHIRFCCHYLRVISGLISPLKPRANWLKTVNYIIHIPSSPHILHYAISIYTRTKSCFLSPHGMAIHHTRLNEHENYRNSRVRPLSAVDTGVRPCAGKRCHCVEWLPNRRILWTHFKPECVWKSLWIAIHLSLLTLQEINQDAIFIAAVGNANSDEHVISNSKQHCQLS